MVLTLAAMVAGLWGRSNYSAPPDPGLVAVTAASYVPLFFRNRWPEFTLVAVVAVEVAHLVLQPLLTGSFDASKATAFQPVPIATMAAVYALSLHREPARAWIAGLAAAAVLCTTAFVLYPENLVATTLLMGNLVVIATAIGTAVRHRRLGRERREQAQEQHVRQEVLAERMRIARELHDVLAHNLTLVNAQAGVANYLLNTDPKAAQTALGNITAHTRKAIDDLRATVGLLREEAAVSAPDPASLAESGALAPTHTLEHLPVMLEAFRNAGNTVRFDESGSPVAMPPLNDLSAYRIIQESLTNAAKHARGAAIDIILHWRRTMLEITVTNHRPPQDQEDIRTHRPAGGGHGLIGMRERAAIAGGKFGAGLLPDGGYQVHAFIPTGPGVLRDKP